ncbi:glycine cleavage system protein H [Thermosipho africanus H17ap60334]|jgi:glycine cleavage system H protein|uniref:glycine cleavage system protein GcvH n=1 Tax=Thermosipho africanus TaxID=2421 RepID=UPI00028CA9EF|nr:glycine cleavage system protein GcvH [Thermosipho africanus]EKF50128.1 glycine cleavage system protein H [Thermosipho africanus H17ap60334]MDK2840006.1 glycine cleavage system protein [Thermosipho sp. (in: thermotogales)]RDI90073.1 glycine cleavage system protein H [Thermosipho africanus Ob7]
MKKYSKTHEWILVNNGIGIIGISKRAAEDLGDVTYVDLPEVGKVIEKGEQLCTIESVKAASSVYAPVSGKIIEVNEKLDTTPELISDSAEEEGWIAKIEISDESELEDLMTEEEYEKL